VTRRGWPHYLALLRHDRKIVRLQLLGEAPGLPATPERRAVLAN